MTQDEYYKFTYDHIEGNVLIAVFMDEEEAGNADHIRSALRDGYWLTAKRFFYHSDWNLLMPVVEKIGTIYIQDKDAVKEDCRHWLETFRDNMTRFYCCGLHKAETQIESTWLAVVEFIQISKDRGDVLVYKKVNDGLS
jgi:hypothetical protein